MARSYCEIWAPAKVNLGLKVLGQREDGYHEIVTTFVAVDLYDHIRFAKLVHGGVCLSLARSIGSGAVPIDFPLGEDNLIVRAVRQVERATGIVAHLSITVDKRIPTAAGLGGGSADAAATLRAMQRLYDLRVAPGCLATWASEIGSDVPFFLGGPMAEGRGRGEILRPLELFSGWWAVLICPPIFLSAKEIYGQLGLTSPGPSSNLAKCRDGEGFFAALRRSHNDLEEVVIRRVPNVSYWQEGLKEVGAESVFVSGSGPTVVGVFRHQPPREAVQPLRARNDRVQVFVVRPVVGARALVEQ